MTQVVLQNLAAQRQQAWTFAGLPESIGLVGSTTEGWPWFEVPGGVCIRAELDPMQTVTTTLTADAGVVIPDLDPQVIANAKKLIPRFLGWTRDRQPRWAYDLAILATTPWGKGYRISWRTRIAAPVDLTIEGHTTLYPDSTLDAVDMSWMAVWGTTATPGLGADLDELVMATEGFPVIDHRNRKGLPQPEWLPQLSAWKQWLAKPKTWGRGSRIMWTGRLYPARTFSDFAMAPDHPIVAVANAWAGKWGALGALPVAPPNAALESQQRWDEFQARTMTGAPPGDEYDDRAKGLKKEAGETGDQDDFGACEGEEATVQLKPWAAFDYSWHVQEWGLRPTSNREPSGAPVQAADHPGCKTYNLRPNPHHGTDMLKWDRNLPYTLPGAGFSTQDDQHRSCNLLVADILLRRDPCTMSIVDDEIQLDLMRIWAPIGTATASPRDWGRRLKTYADFVACGFGKARALLDQTVDYLWAGSTMAPFIDDATKVRTFSGNEEKYGYATKPLFLSWQDNICKIGCWAAWLATGDERAKRMALASAETTVRYGFSDRANGGKWWSAYGVRYQAGGVPLPEESYWPSEGGNPDMFAYGMQDWMVSACILMKTHGGDAALRERATTILAAFPANNWQAASWRAIAP